MLIGCVVAAASAASGVRYLETTADFRVFKSSFLKVELGAKPIKVVSARLCGLTRRPGIKSPKRAHGSVNTMDLFRVKHVEELVRA